MSRNPFGHRATAIDAERMGPEVPKLSIVSRILCLSCSQPHPSLPLLLSHSRPSPTHGFRLCDLLAIRQGDPTLYSLRYLGQVSLPLRNLPQVCVAGLGLRIASIEYPSGIARNALTTCALKLMQREDAGRRGSGRIRPNVSAGCDHGWVSKWEYAPAEAVAVAVLLAVSGQIPTPAKVSFV